MLAKRNHSNTSKSMTLDDQATVTVTDPCHPLYHHTFPLLYQTNQRELEPCCLVQIAPGVERLIPTRQTSLSTLPAAGFSCPVDLSSLHNLIKTFAHILAQVEMGGVMILEEQPQQPATAMLPPQVWETLDLIQQQAVLQVVISLCQQILEIWEPEVSHEPASHP